MQNKGSTCDRGRNRFDEQGLGELEPTDEFNTRCQVEELERKDEICYVATMFWRQGGS